MAFSLRLLGMLVASCLLFIGSAVADAEKKAPDYADATPEGVKSMLEQMGASNVALKKSTQTEGLSYATYEYHGYNYIAGILCNLKDVGCYAVVFTSALKAPTGVTVDNTLANNINMETTLGRATVYEPNSGVLVFEQFVLTLGGVGPDNFKLGVALFAEAFTAVGQKLTSLPIVSSLQKPQEPQQQNLSAKRAFQSENPDAYFPKLLSKYSEVHRLIDERGLSAVRH